MNKINYALEGERQISELSSVKKDILLHCCCAPCASACMERIKESFNILAFFYNPNIPAEEYERRKSELIRFLSETGWGKLVECEHDEASFASVAKGLEACPEGGERCERCFELRLKRTAEAAKNLGVEYVATTLTLSPLKNASLINQIGERVCEKEGVTWLYSDFKKNDGYLRSCRLSKEHNLYRQNFCGCVYSRRNDINCS
ncbi:MAG: epoxyqueuosine reductase QueH [Clostridia bacterium]|nr:epoxyqueuosine reductase QueH [Clostridia bacterium]